MICPRCNTTNNLTWKKYFLSPLGKHRCIDCQATFRISHNYSYYLGVTLLALLLAAPLAFLYFHYGITIIQALLSYLIVLLVVLMPIDKNMDNACIKATLSPSMVTTKNGEQ